MSEHTTTDRAALRDRIAELRDQMLHALDSSYVIGPLGWNSVEALMDAYDDAVLAVLPPPVSRADILREAAALADRLSMEIEQAMKTREIGPLTALQDLADELRRMADEAQPAEQRGVDRATVDRAVEALRAGNHITARRLLESATSSTAEAQQDGARPTHDTTT
ncbi:hypothetical protein ACPXCS_06135 [Streptomyces sp. DT190]|uniref:hypothetical protein n=1 Tax=unclassified Streptomyces TaxID=2593676 RepID=UPI003CEFCDE2